MSLLPFFQWMEALAFSEAIRESSWIGPAVNAVHILALVLLLGAILIVDLRLLGSGMTSQSVAQVARDARPWMIAGLVGMVATGIPQLTSTAMKEYDSPFFWPKMEILLVAVIFTFTIRRMVTMADEGRVGSFWSKVVGLISIALWTSVAIEGRLIGLLS